MCETVLRARVLRGRAAGRPKTGCVRDAPARLPCRFSENAARSMGHRQSKFGRGTLRPYRRAENMLRQTSGQTANRNTRHTGTPAVW
jgi:hypothetical protein